MLLIARFAYIPSSKRGLEPITSWLRVICLNHKTMAPRFHIIIILNVTNLKYFKIKVIDPQLTYYCCLQQHFGLNFHSSWQSQIHYPSEVSPNIFKLIVLT